MKNIVLIGMMGSGKSSVGKALAQKLQRPFIDTDALIEQRESKSIQEIFELYGENYFRKLEQDVVRELAVYDNHVISTGGGMVMNQQNVDSLKLHGKLFYLRNGVEELEARLGSARDNRPLLGAGKELRDTLQRLLDQRESVYIASADTVIENQDLEETVMRIAALADCDKEDPA